MKRKVIILFSFFCMGGAFAEEMKFTPHIYSRGGVTLNRELNKEAGAVQNDTWNLGPWGDVSNSFGNNLTEFTLESTYTDKFKHFLGVDVDNDRRYMGNDTTSVNQRLNYVEIYNGDTTAWFGQRAYRGDGEFLTASFPFDEHNMFGGGLRFGNVGPLNVEFAYGVRNHKDYDETDADGNVTNTHQKHTNILINKLEYPLEHGKIKSNLEYHKTYFYDSNDVMTEAPAFMAGVQWQNWGLKPFGGNWYNIIVLNYSKGHIYGGAMQSAFNSNDKDTPAAKLLFQYAGDFKKDRMGLYYVLKYQNHMGSASDQAKTDGLADGDFEWSTLDAILRPQYGLTEHFTLGLEWAKRNIVTENDATPTWAKKGGATRHALMASYNVKEWTFGSPVFRAFVGTIKRDNPKSFFLGESTSKSSNFIRLTYEVSVH